MNQNFYFPVPDQLISTTHCNNSNYLEMYQKSIEDPESFWKDQGQRIDWYKPYTKVKEVNFTYPDVTIKWFFDGTLNACYNCVDRHLEQKGDQIDCHYTVFLNPFFH